MMSIEKSIDLGRYELRHIIYDSGEISHRIDQLGLHRFAGSIIPAVRHDLRSIVNYTQRLPDWYARTDLDALGSQVARDIAILLIADIDFERYFNAHIGRRQDYLESSQRTVRFDQEELKNSQDAHSSDKFAHHMGSERLRLFEYQDRKHMKTLANIPTDIVMRYIDGSNYHGDSQAIYQAVDGDVLVDYCQRLSLALGRVQVENSKA